MQEISNIFTGTENIFKLLFINGIIMIFVALFYPLQKSNELAIKIVEINQKALILNHQINELNSESKIAKAEIFSLTKEIEKLISKKSEKNTKLIKEKNTKSIELNKKLHKSYNDFKLKKIEYDSELCKVKQLESQQKTYDRYCKGLLYVGIAFLILGLVGWLCLTYFIFDKEHSDYVQRRTSNALSNKYLKYGIIFLGFIIVVLIFALIYI